MARRTQVVVFVTVLSGFLLSGFSIANAQSEDEPSKGQPFVVLTGQLRVEQRTTVEDAIIFDGNAVIDGTVNGNLVAFNGDIFVNGTVNGDVVAFNGRVTVDATGLVRGDVSATEEPTIEGTVEGKVQTTAGLRTDGLVVVGRVAFWFAATISSLLFGLIWLGLFPRSGEAVAEAGRTAVGPSIGLGLALFIGIPIVGGIMLVTLVGGLFGVALLTGMVLLYSIAYAAGALALGRLLLKSPRKIVLAFLLGWAILRVLALVPVLGGFLFFVAAVWGFGALIVAARRAGRASGPAALPATDTVGGTPAPPPMPTLPEA